MIKKVLLLGASGLLGRELHRELSSTAIPLLAPSKHTLNISDETVLISYLEKHKPDIIINAIGLHGIQQNDTKPDLSKSLNVDLPRILASYTKASGSCNLIHFSTVEVYGCNENAALSKVYTEDSAVKPKCLYTQNKLKGEVAVQENCNDYLIFRLGALYDQRQLYQSGARDPITIGAPTSAQYVAYTIARSISRIGRRVIKTHPGIYNLSCKGDADWQAFAREVAAQREKMRVLEPNKGLITVGPRLSLDKAENTFCLFLPTWQALLKSVLAERPKVAS